MTHSKFLLALLGNRAPVFHLHTSRLRFAGRIEAAMAAQSADEKLLERLHPTTAH